ncbi:MAG TPA: MBL fold metallo-hydrolase [Gemmatimonadales bacterium]|jgi:7,8-dihydropterin-6-yl-methyl-4-(beta-D-ribofuranosyl)aminobenzene 5'-phosphate synthase
MRSSRALCLAVGVILTMGAAAGPTDTGRAEHRVKSLKITILSTMLADQGVGEWGFSALVEADGHRILFDTGNRPETVLQNARDLKIDLSTITDVVLSHHHGDHTGGLLVLRQELARNSPNALSRIHVAPGIFLSRRHPGSEQEANPIIAMKSGMEKSGAVFVEHRTPGEIFPGVWVSGPVPRPNPEKFWGVPTSIVTKGGLVADSIPEDMALIINTDRGFVLVVGCGHAGTINTVEYSRKIVGPEPVYALIGGLHLFAASDSAVAWTAGRLRADHLGYLLGAHCTGIEAVFRIRELAALDRKRAVVAAVGSSFDANKGIDPLQLAQ